MEPGTAAGVSEPEIIPEKMSSALIAEKRKTGLLDGGAELQDAFKLQIGPPVYPIRVETGKNKVTRSVVSAGSASKSTISVNK
jgi:hypothetical protein